MTKVSRMAAGLAVALFVLGVGLRAQAADANVTPMPGDLVAGPNASGQGAEFRFILALGSIGFVLPGDWPTVGMQPGPPVCVAAFQIPNPADAGTGESTNVAVSVLHLTYTEAKAARASVGRAYGPTPPTVTQYHGWTVYRQDAQSTATYTIIDAVRDFRDLDAAVTLRLAWPHLAGNAKTYDADMEALARSMLDGVSATPGPYTPGPREVVRRPTYPKPLGN